ncbi:MAG: cadherin-like beta sandwich domain-containing protein [Burkholderiaceae bacterium]|nr:cadherin-like beta sandwich domain-containing protein [Burkholderiaceae bacterium]
MSTSTHHANRPISIEASAGYEHPAAARTAAGATPPAAANAADMPSLLPAGRGAAGALVASEAALPARRRQTLGLLGALGALGVAACGGGGSSSTASTASTGTTAASNNAQLAGLSVSSGALSPSFDAATTNYTLTLAFAVTSLTLVATAADSAASVRINGTSVASGGSFTLSNLAVGATAVSIVVTAADGTTTRSYSVQVTRSAGSADAALTALVPSVGALSPSFAAATTSYDLALDNGSSTLAFTATASNANASIRINGVTVASGSSSGAIAIAVGTTVITIAVTAEDGISSRSYAINVTRAAAAASAIATLDSLAVSAGTLTPNFSSGVSSYQLTVANTVTSLGVTAVSTHPAATIRINGATTASGATAQLALAVGSNIVAIVVTAQDGVTVANYSINVTRAAASASSNAALSALSPSAGSLTPAFAANITSYTMDVANGIASLTFTPAAADGGATIRVNGTIVASGSASGAVALAVGTNTVSIVVTAADGTSTRTYTVVVTRAAAVAGSCVLIPTETIGPFPLLAVLSNSIIVRKDIRESKTGVPLTLRLNLMRLSGSCAPIKGAAVYIWHCDKDGLYSGYSEANNPGQAGLTYLRGVQLSDDSGQVEFTTIYPGWYAGRITHIHFQVYLNNNLNVTATATSQLCFPQSVTQAVYNSALYTKGQNTSVTSFGADNVFSDGTTYQMVDISGSVASGYVATLNVGIA